MGVVCGSLAGLAGFAHGSRRSSGKVAISGQVPLPQARRPVAPRQQQRGALCSRRAAVDPAALEQLATQICIAASEDLGFTPTQAAAAVEATVEALRHAPQELVELLGPPQPAEAFDAGGAASSAVSSVTNFFYDPRMQYDEKGNILLDPQGNPLPDNLWTQFVAVQATLIKRLNEGIHGLGVEQSFGWSVALYTLLIRTALYPFVKTQLETTAKMQVLKPRVDELKKQYKDNEDRLQQEVGLLYMDLQIDPLGVIIPLLLQLPVFWGLYRAVRRLAIVDYPPLREPWLWIPSLFGPNYKPDPDFGWLISWQGPLIELHPKIGWELFGLYMILPVGVAVSYYQVLKESLEDKDSPAILKVFPFFLAFICVELPQAMGIYIATNIASSVALTAYTKNEIQSKIPGYAEFVETGKWPPGVDPERVLAKAFGVQRLTGDGMDMEDPITVPECVFAGRADYIPTLLEEGKTIDDFDDRGIPASAYTLALNNKELLERLFDMGASPKVLDKKGNCLLHYMAGYGRKDFFPLLTSKGLDSLLDHVNEDGQTPLDVARVNLSSETVANDCREVMVLLKEAGAAGKQTTEEDEAKFEAVREKKKREESVNAARSALMALAAQSGGDAADGAPEKAEEAAEAAAAEPAKEEPMKQVAESLDRVKSLDIDALRQRLGANMSEEQLERLTQRLKSMTPEEIAAYTVGGGAAVQAVNDAQAAEEAKEKPVAVAAPAAAPAAAPEPRKQSVIVD